MDSQVEQTPKCTPETLGDACEWISELPVRDLAVGKVPYVRLPAVARDHLADLLAGASSALSASLALPKVESETIERRLAEALALVGDMLPFMEPARLREEADALERKIDRMPVRSLIRRINATLNTGGTHG